ncbi:MAG: carboxypeptidase regulatory-like domain-containing protein [Patescibacteria group bacterium]|jgi:protocatechuate 3,4-dioxygenase beta subunit
MKQIYAIFTVSLMTLIGLTLGAQPVRAADAVVSGTVTNSTGGTPVSSLYVYVEDAVTGTYDWDYTDAVGAYSITITDDGTGTAGDYIMYTSTSSGGEVNTVYIKELQSFVLAEGENKSVNLSLTRRAKFSGFVYQSDGVTPIYNAYVSYTNNNGYTVGSGYDYSAYSGAYFTSPSPYPDTTQSAVGEYYAVVTASGYFGTRIDDLTLGDNETTTTQNFTLTGQSTVSGNVVNANASPVVGATVTLDDLNSSYSYHVTTDSAGNYTINVYDLYDYDGTAIGNYSLIVTADGFVTKSKSFDITADESTSTGNDVVLHEAGTMTGTILEGDGTTVIADATIQADNGKGSTYSTTSAADGTFSLTGLKASSSYILTVSKTGFVTNVVYGVAVVAGETTADQNIQLTAAVTLSGSIVVNQAGDAIGGATISLFNRNKPRSSSYDYTATSFTDGTFIINNINPGHYRVQVSQSGYIKYKKENLDLTTAVSGKTYKLYEAAVIFGRVTAKNGSPIHNALVTASTKAATDLGYGSAYTDMNGNYRISSLQAGKYTVKISTTGYVEKVVTVHAKKGQSKELNKKLQVAGSISGQIRDAATGLPLSYYTVRVKNESVVATADYNGYYTLDGLAPGKYTVYIISTAYQTDTSSAHVSANKETKNINFALTEK